MNRGKEAWLQSSSSFLYSSVWRDLLLRQEVQSPGLTLSRWAGQGQAPARAQLQQLQKGRALETTPTAHRPHTTIKHVPWEL